MPLSSILSHLWNRFQGELFSALSHERQPLNERHQRLVAALDLQPVETFFRQERRRQGRPQKDRDA